MKLHPKIISLETTTVVGMKQIMTFAQNTTPLLWRSFMPRRHEIDHKADNNLYSIEIFNNTSFFEQFNPTTAFEKWAAVKVTEVERVPDGMETITIPAGLYAVFQYKGKGSEAMPFFQAIYKDWLPNSGHILDNRPHFALMGEKYKNEHLDSEEEIWVPIKEK